MPGVPNLQISGFENIGLTPPEGRSDLTWHITDIIFILHGATPNCVSEARFGQAHLNESITAATGLHSLSMGRKVLGIVRRSRLRACRFLAGNVQSSTIWPLVIRNVLSSFNAFNLYFQDSWQVTKG